MGSRVCSSLHGSSRSVLSSSSTSPQYLGHTPLFRFRPRQPATQPRPRHSSTSTTSTISPDRIIRPLVPPPREGSGPLLSRRPDRALPNISRTSIWIKTLPIFVALVGLSSLAIFNYQKSSSSTVNSILYALRTNPHAREILGDEIYFASKVPWIRGELSPMQGTIDITFWVKGTKGTAQTKFVSIRKKGAEFFETLEWSLKTPGADGQMVQLLEMEGTRDPIAGQKI
ncbi:cytochrome oxidase assembly protein 1 [Rhinocladiella similis]